MDRELLQGGGAMASQQGTRKTQKKNSARASTKSQTNKSTTKRTTTKKSVTNSKQRQQERESIISHGTIQDEIILVITFVVAIVLFLSNFGLCGTIGGIFSNFFFGCIGFLAYLLPLFLFFGIAFYISNIGNKLAIRKIIAGAAFVISLAALIQLVSTPYESNMKVLQFYTEAYQNHSGGGILGGLLMLLVCKPFDVVGGYIILIALLTITITLMTGKAMFTYLVKRTNASYASRKEYQRLRKEEMEARQQEMKQMTLEDFEKNRRPAKTFIIDKNVLSSQGSPLVGGNLKKSQKQDSDEKQGLDPFANLKIIKHTDKSADEKEKQQAKDNIKEPGKTMEDTKEELPIVDLSHAFDMEELDVEPVIHGLSQMEAGHSSSTNHSYEEELRHKFGKAEDSSGDELPETVLKHKVDTTDVDDDDIPVELYRQDYIHRRTKTDDNDFSTKETHSSTNVEQKSITPTTGVEQSKMTETKNTMNQNNRNGGLTNQSTSEDDSDTIQIEPIEEVKQYVFPPIDLLKKPSNAPKGMTDKSLKETAMKLQKTLESFGVRVTVTNISCGPSVTRYELQPEQGVKVSKITALADDIKLNLAAADVRIEAPIPGKAAVGIEVPNSENSMVYFRDLIENNAFCNHPSDIAFAVGKDIGGKTVVTDIAKMPHLLIAGATGSGKSVCINTLIMSILYKASPSDVRLIMVDPKVVELSVYNGIPHLLIPVVTDPKKASAALNWAVLEMTERYKKFADLGVRDLKGYNEKVANAKTEQEKLYQKLPQIVIIVDELADLMMVAPGEVEDAICRLAQMARAAGLHLIIATQRPSVNVITGLIKANVPSRIAFSVSSAIDSRTIIDGSGAEKLLGKGDMLFFPSGYPKPVRVQGAFISDKEVSDVVDFLKENNGHAVMYSEDITSKIANAQVADTSAANTGNDQDEYFVEAGKFIIEKDKASIGMLQRVYKIGFNRAARIMDQLSEAGVVGPEEGTKPRKVLMTLEQFEEYLNESAQ